jgi:hypothetical protein
MTELTRDTYSKSCIRIDGCNGMSCIQSFRLVIVNARVRYSFELKCANSASIELNRSGSRRICHDSNEKFQMKNGYFFKKTGWLKQNTDVRKFVHAWQLHEKRATKRNYFSKYLKNEELIK